MICSACGNQMNPGSRFCNHCGGAVMGVPVYPTRSRLVRPRYGRAIAGVCAAFAQEAYLVAWIAIPNEPYFFPMQPYAQTPPTPSSDPAAATSGSQPAA
jgi:phage shock protein C